MKRILRTLCFILGLVLSFTLLTSEFASAASTVTITRSSRVTDSMHVFTISITADTDGSVTSTATPFEINGDVVLAITNPGATAPQADYDITLTDSDGADVMGGTMVDRSASASERAYPDAGDSNIKAFVEGPLTVNVSNNNVNGALIVITVYFER